MILFFILFFVPHPIAIEFSEVFVVWNVGQGAAASLINEHRCIHIDMGGEQLPPGLTKFCRNRDNYLYITHYDWDHINLVKKVRKKIPQICLMNLPDKKISRSKHQLLDEFEVCKTSPVKVQQMGRSKFDYANESNSYLIENKILITGDAPQKQERDIVRHLPLERYKIQIILLGHHGSRTSTGPHLLKNLPGLRLAIASARKKRYGHPHREVMARLKTAAVPMLSTEDFGHIFIELHH